jgi:hypothetical protein
MEKTHAYFSMIDSQFDPSQFTSGGTFTHQKLKNEDDNYEITIRNKSLDLRMIDDYMIEYLNKCFENDMSSYFVHNGELTIRGRMSYPTDKKLNAFASKINDVLIEKINTTPLTGDSVRICFGDNAYPEDHPNIKDGAHYLISYVRDGYNGTYYKLKGVDGFIEGDIMDLEVKYQPKPKSKTKDLDAELSI